MGDITPIKGKVARILTSRQLALNVGEQDGVRVGMLFEVLDPKGEDIKDPDSGEVLGSVPRPKVRVRVTHVEQKLSLAETFRKRKTNVGGSGLEISSGLSKLFMPPTWVDRYETLKTTEKTWEDLDESESFVKTGDPVVQVFEPDPAAEGEDALRA
jgi:hypothetical protein